jgi:acetate kinase
MTAPAPLLILNAGSSSLKFALYRPGGAEPALLLRGQFAGIGRGLAFSARSAAGTALTPPDATALGAIRNHADALLRLPDWLAANGLGRELAGAGHRVVHGGTRFTAPERVTPATLDELASLEPLAPHHQPHNVAAIRALVAQRPALPQVACFDTAFHAGMPPAAKSLGLPADFEAKGMRRYGFHGLSYEYVTDRLAQLCGGRLPRRLIIAHLGNGASMAAVLDGKGHATTMGFSTLDGIVMGTRIGSLDPGAILHLMREEHMDLTALEDLLYNKCGLLGLSGISADMKTLLESRDPRAAAAVEQYCYAIARHAGSLAAALGGLDALVFTGGVGENAAPIRARVCRELAWLGLDFDAGANEKAGPVLTRAGAKVATYVIPTDEERVIARHTQRLLGL